MPKIDGVRVAILATDLFEEAELIQPRQALEQAGAKTIVIAPKAGKIQAVRHDEKTGQIDVDLTLEKADPGDFDAVLVPGGAMNADALRVEKKKPADGESGLKLQASSQDMLWHPSRLVNTTIVLHQTSLVAVLWPQSLPSWGLSFPPHHTAPETACWQNARS